MKTMLLPLSVWIVIGLGLARQSALAQTAGSAKMEVTILDYTGTTSASHYTVAWVTTEAGAFIKSLRKQGPSSWTSSEWGNHCGTWNAARAGSTVLDGYTSATATTYSGTNSPVILTWNCRDAANNLVPNGNYKFWVQYAENSGQGPFTTSGLLWTKGAAGLTNTYPNQGVNFSTMRVTWTPSVAPQITSAPLPATAVVGVPYSFSCTATGTAPVTFAAPGLPTGLTISTSGAVSGTPKAAGSFSGSITASNGTLPNGTQPFSITVTAVPAKFTSVELNGNNLILSASGPANGRSTLLSSADPAALTATWANLGTKNFGATGEVRYTNAITPGSPRLFYKLQVP